MNERQKPEGSRIGFEPGTILRLISSTYPRPILALLEAIQNAVDSSAKEINVVVNLKTRSYTVEDNGCGLSAADFEKQLATVGKSKKAENPGEYYGYLGLGLIAFYGKFSQYTFTSTSKAEKSRPGWGGYSSHDIAHMVEVDGQFIIPRRERPDLTKQIPSWNTQVVVSDPTMRNAKLILTLADLANEVQNRHGVKIEEHGARVTIVLVSPRGKRESVVITKAPVFRGRQLKLIREDLPGCCRVTGQLFFRDDKGGTVFINPGVGINRLPFHPNVSAQLGEISGHKDMIEDLSSGWFDGVISCAQLEMNPDRLHLVENDAFVDFACWLESYHRMYLDQFTRELKEDADQRLDRQLLTQIVEHLKSIDLDFFTDLIASISQGAAHSTGHVKKPDDENVEPGLTKLAKPRLPSGNSESEKEETSRKQRQKPEKEKSLHHIDVMDSAGHARKFSKSHAGFRLCLDDLRGSAAHFQWEPEHSLLIINRRNHDYSNCKGDENRKRVYLETIIKIALSLQLISEDVEGFNLMREALVKLLLINVIMPTAKKTGRK